MQILFSPSEEKSTSEKGGDPKKRQLAFFSFPCFFFIQFNNVVEKNKKVIYYQICINSVLLCNAKLSTLISQYENKTSFL